jgi:isopenicillin-N epimerase
VVFLNHGSFGACPRGVLDHQAALRTRLEAGPVRFFRAEYEPLLDASRSTLAGFLGADPADLVFVANATSGVNAVVRSLRLGPGDEILVTDHAYNACRNAAGYAAARAGARVVVAPVPFPLASAEEVTAAVMAAVTPRTRLALLDHVTSPTGLVFPIADLVAALEERGIDTLVDGAHAPGMVPVRLDRLGAAYYTGNCHKWVCAPKGAGFLHVRRDRQEGVVPPVVSHGLNSPRTDRSRFHLLFDWTGTDDPTARLCVGAALEALAGMDPDGWPGVMSANRALALAGRRVLCAALEVNAPAPEDMIGSLAAVALPDPPVPAPPDRPDPLQAALFERHGIEVPIVRWPSPDHRVVRISAQRYNSIEQYGVLAEVLPGLLAAERTG